MNINSIKIKHYKKLNIIKSWNVIKIKIIKINYYEK